MKMIIPIHSFLDLVTNSSSEIFILANDKSIETVKGIIENLAGLDDQLNDHSTSARLFDDIFREIKVCEYDFNYSLVPETFRNRYSEKSPDELYDRQRTVKYPDYKSRSYKKDLDQYYKETSAIYHKWSLATIENLAEIYKEFLKQNGLYKKEIGRIEETLNWLRSLPPEGCENFRFSGWANFNYKDQEENAPHNTLLRNFYECMDFCADDSGYYQNCVLHKGDIICYGRDNEIPHTLMDAIITHLNPILHRSHC